MGDGRNEYNAKCQVCSKDVTLRLRPEDIAEWQAPNPRHVQLIFQYLTPAERELLVSGTCGECWNKLFPPEPEEDRGEPVGWYDLPTWLKGAMDRGDEALAFAKGLTWYRLAEDAYVSYRGNEYVGFYEHERE